MKKISQKPSIKSTPISTTPKSDMEIIRTAMDILSKDKKENSKGALMTATVKCRVPLGEREKKCSELLPQLNKEYEHKQTRIR